MELPGKRSSKMLSFGGRLQEVVAYESLYQTGSKFFLIRIQRLNPCANVDVMFYSSKSQFEEKNLVFPIEKFRSLALA